MVERLVAAEQVIGSNPIVTFSVTAVDDGSDVECRPFILVLPVALCSSPSIWWLRLRLVYYTYLFVAFVIRIDSENI